MRGYCMRFKGNAMRDEFKRKAYRIKLDAEHLIFYPVGFEGAKKVQPTEYDIDWDLIFGSYPKLTTAQLIDRLNIEYGMSRATATRHMESDLVRLERGVYGRRAHESDLDPYEPD